jgi:hypothetical protein
MANEVTVEEGAWLTELEDWGAPRPGTGDLFFVPDEDQSPLRRPDVIDVVRIEPLFVRAGAFLLLAVGGAVAWAVWHRRRRAQPAGG